jgi:hypothetical protein
MKILKHLNGNYQLTQVDRLATEVSDLRDSISQATIDPRGIRDFLHQSLHRLEQLYETLSPTQEHTAAAEPAIHQALHDIRGFLTDLHVNSGKGGVWQLSSEDQRDLVTDLRNLTQGFFDFNQQALHVLNEAVRPLARMSAPFETIAQALNLLSIPTDRHVQLERDIRLRDGETGQEFFMSAGSVARLDRDGNLLLEVARFSATSPGYRVRVLPNPDGSPATFIRISPEGASRLTAKTFQSSDPTMQWELDRTDLSVTAGGFDITARRAAVDLTKPERRILLGDVEIIQDHFSGTTLLRLDTLRTSSPDDSVKIEDLKVFRQSGDPTTFFRAHGGLSVFALKNTAVTVAASAFELTISQSTRHVNSSFIATNFAVRTPNSEVHLASVRLRGITQSGDGQQLVVHTNADKNGSAIVIGRQKFLMFGRGQLALNLDAQSHLKDFTVKFDKVVHSLGGLPIWAENTIGTATLDDNHRLQRAQLRFAHAGAGSEFTLAHGLVTGYMHPSGTIEKINIAGETFGLRADGELLATTDTNVLQSVHLTTMRGEMLFHRNGHPSQITFRGRQGTLAGGFGEVTIGHDILLMARLTLDQQLEALTIDAAGGAMWKKGDLQLTTKGVHGNVGFDAQGKPLHIEAEVNLLRAINAGSQAVSGTGLKLSLSNGNYAVAVAQGELIGPRGLSMHGKGIRIHIPTVRDQLTGGMVTVQTLSAGDQSGNVTLGRLNAQVTLDAQQAWQRFSVTARDGVARAPGGLYLEGKRLHFEGTTENGTHVYRGEASRIMATAMDDAGRPVGIQLPRAVLTIRQEQERTLTAFELPGDSHVQWGDFTFALENGEGNQATMMSTADGQVQDFTLRFPSPVEITNAADGKSATIKRARLEDVQTIFKNDNSNAYLTLQSKEGLLTGTGGKVVFKGLEGAAGNRYAFLRMQELQGNWTSEVTRGVEQRFGGKLFGLQVQLDDTRLTGDLKAQELWAEGKLAFVMQSANGAFAEVRFDKTDEQYWGTLHARGNLNFTRPNGDRVQLDNGSKLVITTQQRGMEITGTDIALHTRLHNLEGSANIHSGQVALGDGPIVIKDLRTASFRFANKRGQWAGKATIDQLKDAMLAYGFGDITKGQDSYLALIPKAQGESIRFTGTFHLRTPAGPVRLKVDNIDSLEALLRQPSKNRLVALVRAPSGQGWAELKLSRLVSVRGNNIVLEGSYEPFSGYGAVDMAFRRFALDEIYMSQAVVLSPDAKRIQVQTPQGFPVLGAMRVLFGGENPIFRIPGGSRPFEQGPLAPAVDLLIGGRFSRAEIALTAGIDPASQTSVQVSHGQVLALGVPINLREFNYPTSGRIGMEFSVANAKGIKTVTGGAGVLVNVLGVQKQNSNALFIEETPMAYWGAANVAFGSCQIGGAVTAEEQLGRWWAGIGGSCRF